MTDYWNDPPEEPEVPECCGQEMFVVDDGVLWCGVCKHLIEPPVDPVPPPNLVLVDDVPVDVICPHGNTESCDKCEYLADLAFDAAREQRLSR